MSLWSSAVASARGIFRGKPTMAKRLESEERLERLAKAPIAFHPTVRFQGIGGSTQPLPDTLLQNSIGWSAIAMRAIADQVAALVPCVYRKLADGTEELLELDHPLVNVLNASTVHSPMNTRRLLAQYLGTVGEAYLLKVRGEQIFEPVQLWIMPPQRVVPIGELGSITAYLVTNGGGGQVIIDAEDVIRIWWPDPENPYLAEGLLAPQAIVADSSKFADETLRSHFESNATPKTVITSDAESDVPDPGEQDRINELWRQRFDRRRGRWTGLPAWLPSGFDIKELADVAGTEALEPMLNHFRDQVLAAYHVPKSVVGLTDEAGLGRATAETNFYVFLTVAVKPIADLIAEALTLQLARTEFGEDLAVRWEPYIPTDKEFELKKDDVELRNKRRSINELRDRDGEEPASWGDLPVGSIGEAPYTGEEPAPLPPDVPNALAADASSSAGDSGGADRARGSARTEDFWARFVQRERTFAPAFERELHAVFAMQERVTRRAFEAELARGEDLGLVRAELTALEAERLLAQLLAPGQWARVFDKRTEKVRRRAYVSSGQDALELVGTGGPFRITPETSALLQRMAADFQINISATTTKTLARRLADALSSSVLAGESLSDRTQRVLDAIGSGFDVRRNQARTIARTETATATESAQIDGFRRSGVVASKRWNTSRDDAVRDSHEIDGQVVPLELPFKLADGEAADAPGVGARGHSLSAGNRINCRCFVTPVIGK